MLTCLEVRKDAKSTCTTVSVNKGRASAMEPLRQASNLKVLHVRPKQTVQFRFAADNLILYIV